MVPDEKNWYAVYTKSRCEKKVAIFLDKKGIENYCPLAKVQRQWSDRKKYILEPVFKSYVFVRISRDEQLAVLQTSAILNFVYWLDKPAIIRTEEINIMKEFLSHRVSKITLEKVNVQINDMVKIISGPLLEQEGQVISINHKKLKIILPSLGYLMHVTIENSNIEAIRRPALNKIVHT